MGDAPHHIGHPCDAPCHVRCPPSSHVLWQASCWKFEKLQIMPLGFGYLESSEKSEKIHKYYTYRAIIAEIYKAQWQVLTEIQAIFESGPESRQETSLGVMAWMTGQNES